jgi:hypothetical protein
VARRDFPVRGPDVAVPDVADLPRRDRATLGAGHAAPAPVTRELAARIMRGFCPGWDVWPLGSRFVAAPEGADALTDPAVVNAGSMGELIVKISETASAR